MNKRLDRNFKAERDAIIRERHARGQKYRALWRQNTAKLVAQELGVNCDQLRNSVHAGHPVGRITQEQLEEAAPRIKAGQRYHDLYMKDSMQQICADWGMGNTTYERVVAEAGVEPDDPVHKFLTMRLVG